jgi:hypothetical protein
MVADDSMVRCPKCGNVFASGAVRFFGIVSPRGIKIIHLCIVGAVLLFVAYILVQ